LILWQRIQKGAVLLEGREEQRLVFRPLSPGGERRRETYVYVLFSRRV
jgi:hypothetical protein